MVQLAALPVPEWDADEPRQAIEEILRLPGLRDDRSLLERIIDQVLEWLRRLLDVALGSGGGTAVAWVVTGVLVAVIVFFLFRLLRGVSADPGASAATGDDIGRPAVDWRAEAEVHEAEGRWGDAVRCRYRAAVADLAARGVVEEVPGRTAGTYRRLVHEAMPAVADDFSEMTTLFERVWYGGRVAGRAEAERMGELVLAVSGDRRGAS